MGLRKRARRGRHRRVAPIRRGDSRIRWSPYDRLKEMLAPYPTVRHRPASGAHLLLRLSAEVEAAAVRQHLFEVVQRPCAERELCRPIRRGGPRHSPTAARRTNPPVLHESDTSRWCSQFVHDSQANPRLRSPHPSYLSNSRDTKPGRSRSASSSALRRSAIPRRTTRCSRSSYEPRNSTACTSRSRHAACHRETRFNDAGATNVRRRRPARERDTPKRAPDGTRRTPTTTPIVDCASES